MSRFEKLKERFMSLPSDYTYSEAKNLLEHLGFEERNKGKTSGSRVCFYRESDKRIIMLHKPHPGNIMKRGAIKQLAEQLKDWGEI